MSGKLPLVSWGAHGVAKDMARIREFVEAGAARVAFALLIDEGRYFRHRQPYPGAVWRDWESSSAISMSFWANWTRSSSGRRRP